VREPSPVFESPRCGAWPCIVWTCGCTWVIAVATLGLLANTPRLPFAQTATVCVSSAARASKQGCSVVTCLRRCAHVAYPAVPAVPAVVQDQVEHMAQWATAEAVTPYDSCERLLAYNLAVVWAFLIGQLGTSLLWFFGSVLAALTCLLASPVGLTCCSLTCYTCCPLPRPPAALFCFPLIASVAAACPAHLQRKRGGWHCCWWQADARK